MRIGSPVAGILLAGLLCGGVWGQEVTDPGSLDRESGVASPSPEPVDEEDPNAGLRLPVRFQEGVPIQRVYVHLRATAEGAEADQRKRQVEDNLSLWAGDPFSPVLAEQCLEKVGSLDWVQDVEYRLYQAEIPGQVVLTLLVRPRPVATEEVVPSADPTPVAIKPEVPLPRGVLYDGTAFPVLYEDDDSKVGILGAGAVAAFWDENPFFGNGQSFAFNPSGSQIWPEMDLEGGLYGITQLGDTPAYLYGAGSYMLTASGSDSFNLQSRLYGAIEKLYGGVLIADPDSPIKLNLSAGRQPFQLNRNYLFGQVRGSANAGPRAATYLSARTAYQSTVVGKLRAGNVLLQGFYLNPDELPAGDTDTRYVGGQVAYNDNQNLELSLSYVSVPHSNFAYAAPGQTGLTREGTWVLNPRLRVTSLFGLEGLWLETEWAHQGNTRFPMSADGYYGWLGYTDRHSPLRWGTGYRYAVFSGDNPNTPTYERFDPFQSGGLGDWLQGINISKVFPNTNLRTHNLNFRFWPEDNWELSLDYFALRADSLTNLGGSRPLQQLTSYDLGQELQLASRCSLSPNLFLLGVGSVAFPGQALRQAFAQTQPWYTFQMSLFINL